MAKLNQSGFTLVELILVMAISSLLITVVLAGQGQLRSQARFDAAVNKLVSSINATRVEATSAINIEGNGDGISLCGGGGSNSNNYVFAGVSWVATNTGQLSKNYYKVVPGGNGSQRCVFDTQDIKLEVPVSIANQLTPTGGRILFIRRTNGGLAVCNMTNVSTNVDAKFQTSSCTAGGGAMVPNLTLTITDTDGHSSEISVDGSGLAQRSN